GTSSALSSWASSSRAAGVSAVTSGVPQASAWNALFGITRRALSEVPKIPRAAPAWCSSPESWSYSTQGAHSTFGGRVSSGAPGGGQVEVAGVADEHDVELGVGLPQEAQLGHGQARGRADACLPALAPPLPDALVPLDDVDSGAAQAGDHLRVPRVVAVVRAEVEDSHRALGPWSLSSGAPGLLPAASVSRERARV